MSGGRFRFAMLSLAVVRGVVAVLAIPLAPILYKEHFVVLVLLRPTKDVLLAGGFLLRLGRIDFVPLLAAAIPLSIFGVWQFYYLGRAYSKQLASGRLPGWVRRVVRPDRIRTMRRLLERKGSRLVFLGRLAVFPSSVVATAAGSGEIKASEFLPVDGIGALAAFVEVVGAGYLLGSAYKEAGPWLTIAGIVALAAAGFVVARFLRRQ